MTYTQSSTLLPAVNSSLLPSASNSTGDVTDTLQAPPDNSSGVDQQEQLQFYQIVLPVIISFTVLTSVVSSVVACCLPWVKRPLSATVRLSLSLAVANTFFAVTFTLYLVLDMYLPKVLEVPVPQCLQLALEVVRLAAIILQIFHLLLVAVNHYVGIVWPLHYTALVTSARLRALLIALWFTPLLGMFTAFSVIPGEGFQSPNCTAPSLEGQTFRVVWASIFFGSTLVIVLVYCHIFFLLNQRSLYLVSMQQRAQIRLSIKTVRTTSMIVVTFVVGWGPAVLKFLLDNRNMYLGAGVNFLFSLKVFTDTFIYALRLPEVRRAQLCMWSQLRGCLRRTLRGPNGPARNDPAGAQSNSSRTASTKLSLGSSTLQRLRSNNRQGSLGCKALVKSASASPSPHRMTRLSSPAPAVTRPPAIKIEVTTFNDDTTVRPVRGDDPDNDPGPGTHRV